MCSVIGFATSGFSLLSNNRFVPDINEKASELCKI